MFRYKLRTLLILLAILPPLLWIGWTKYEAWRVDQERQRMVMLGGNKILLIIDQTESTWVPDLQQQGPFAAPEELRE